MLLQLWQNLQQLLEGIATIRKIRMVQAENK